MDIRYKPDHTAITVSDLDRSVQWYSRMLGFREVQRFEIPKMNARAAFMALDDIYHLEIFEIPGSEPVPAERRELLSDLKVQGTKHMAFGVDDIRAAYDELRAKGAEFLFEPKLGGSGRQYTFFRDPDGILLEIIESQRR